MTGLPPLRFFSFVLVAADLTAQREWYGRVLGFTVRLSGGGEGTGTSFCVMEGAGTVIELTSRGDETRLPATLPEPPTHLDEAGWKTLDLETDDLAALDRHLRDQGVPILWSMRTLSPRRAMTLIRDPEGNLIAFFGPPVE